MSAKEAFVRDVNGGMSVTEAAELHEIARSCAYKWIGRYKELGLAGLEDQPRTPHFSPRRTSQEIVQELLALKEKYPDFGPAKLAPMLEQRHGEHVLAVSTAGGLLSRNGLVRRRKRRQKNAGPIGHPPFEVGGAGDSMTADYKGQFRMKNGALCYPLTIADPFSRYVLAIDALPSTNLEGARKGFERVFREYGVPRQLISDNGSPFCYSRSLGGLTRLSRWWIELGIVPIRIDLGQPQQNGIHERMHRTLKAWIRRNLQSSLRAHQKSFDAFREEFNQVRPHESLGQKPPASALKPYRSFPSRSRIEYDTNMTVRAVRSNGEIKWNGDLLFASEVLAGANLGLVEVDQALWEIYFGKVRLGWLDGISKRIRNSKPERNQNQNLS